MTETYLIPQYDSAKSFYAKAVVLHHDNGVIELKSYNTYVAKLEPATSDQPVRLEVHDLYSKTTQRHIAEFIMQHQCFIESNPAYAPYFDRDGWTKAERRAGIGAAILRYFGSKED